MSKLRNERTTAQSYSLTSTTNATKSSQINCFPQVLNLQTYKLHSLADYPAQIRIYGTTDSYSTQAGYVAQMASIERQQARIHRIRRQCDVLHIADPVPNEPYKHHVIGQSQNFPQELTRFVQTNLADPTTKNFVFKLKAHIFPRIVAVHQEAIPRHVELSNEGTGADFSEDDALQLTQLNHILFSRNKVYCHRILCINYTTYDLQCDFDTVNPRTNNWDIMLLSNSDGNNHLFCYAWVLGIFHMNIEFLWVQWFEVLQGRTATFRWEQLTLNRVKFLPMTDEDAFVFVDPTDVLRACHIIPSFADGPLHSNGVAMSRCASDADDWKCYYVNQ
ncbi:hypothetical protein V8E55_011215 [Tylopilus felleus]